MTTTPAADSKTVSKTALVWDSSKKVLSITDTNGDFLIQAGKPTSVQIKKQSGTRTKWDLLVSFGENIRCFEIESEQRDEAEYFFQQLLINDSKSLFYSAVFRSTFLSMLEDLFKKQKHFDNKEMLMPNIFNDEKNIFLFPRLSERYNIPR